MRARTVVLPSEDPRTFNAFAAAVRADLQPRGPLETILANSVIEAAWRLCRTSVALRTQGDETAHAAGDRGEDE